MTNPLKPLTSLLRLRGASGAASSASFHGSGAPSPRRRRSRLALAASLFVLICFLLGVGIASATAPTVTTDNASSVAYTTAHASGTVDPTDQDTTFHFEYATQADFSDAVPTSEQGPLSAGSGVQSVSENLTGLQSNTTYHLRLVAANTDGTTAVEAADTFTTLTVTAPTAAIDPISAITATSAHFSGTVNPNAPGAAPQDPGFDASWHFECTPACPGVPGGTVPADNTATAVSADATSLDPNTDYQVTLVAQNAGGQATDQASFTTATADPTALVGTLQALSDTDARLTGFVNPHNSSVTDCHFAYSEDLSFSHLAPCTPAPAALTGNDPVGVHATISGLDPGTAYHYRLEASTDAPGSAQADGPDFTTLTGQSPASCPNAALRTGPSAGLPDCRAYEQVSPQDKNGGSVLADTDITRAATDGGAVGFGSFTGFGDARGSGIDVEYIAERGDTDWATHAVTPTLPANTNVGFSTALGLGPSYESEYSPDLSHAVFMSPNPLNAEDPNVANLANLYLRNDMLTPGAGTYHLATACPGCSSPLAAGFPQPPIYAGASADYSHLVFRSPYPLTAGSDASFAHENVFESVNGALRLVSLVPASGSSCSGAACVLPDDANGSFVGISQTVVRTYHGNNISADGSRIVFTVGLGGQGGVFLRLNGDTTIKLNASERTPSLGDGSAEYVGSSTDNSRIFFLSSARLTDDAAATGSTHLYMYDLDAPAGHRLTLVDQLQGASDIALGAFGNSDDGHYVYFAAFVSDGNPAPIAGAPRGRDGQAQIYVWHDGHLSYVGTWRNNGASPQVKESDPDTLTNLYPMNFGGFSAGSFQYARVSPDGRHLLFTSHSGPGLLDPAAHQAEDSNCHGQDPSFGCAQFYLYSADSGRLDCASCLPGGGESTGNAFDRSRISAGLTLQQPYLNHPLSRDGRYVFFSTAQKLVPEDQNGRSDAYEFDAASGQLHLISSGTCDCDSYFMDASADGSDVYFTTADRLVPRDQDDQVDLYDARVNGGLPAQRVLPPASCLDGPSCQGPGSSPPGSQGSGSSSFSGPGNQGKARGGLSPATPKKKCKKGRKLKKCKKSRHANADRGGSK